MLWWWMCFICFIWVIKQELLPTRRINLLTNNYIQCFFLAKEKYVQSSFSFWAKKQECLFSYTAKFHSRSYIIPQAILRFHTEMAADRKKRPATRDQVIYKLYIVGQNNTFHHKAAGQDRPWYLYPVSRLEVKYFASEEKKPDQSQ